MDVVEEVVLRLRRDPSIPSIITCFYTGNTEPAFCAPMSREPLPATELTFDDSFPSVVVQALMINPSVHDGAIMIGRSSVAEEYRIYGWSYRLYPPETRLGAELNRGSAYNSCLAMSAVANVDRLYLISSMGIDRFQQGSVQKLA